MSKETTPTTGNTWTPAFSHENGLTPVQKNTTNGTYAFVGEDLVESRMVINDPNVNSTAASTAGTSSETPTPQQNPEAQSSPVTPEQPAQPHVSNTEIQANHEQARRSGIFRRMGRTAFNAIKHGAKKVDGTLSLLMYKALDKMGGKTLEEREAYQRQLDEKYAPADGDSRWQRIKKSFGRNKLNIQDRVLPYGIVAAFGALAVDRALSISGIVHNQSAGNFDIDASNVQNHEVELLAKTTVFTVGGAGDHLSKGAEAAGEKMGLYDGAARNINAHYSASISPAVGQISMEDSTNEVIPQAFNAYEQAGDGKLVLYGFSEGSVGVWKSAEALAAAGHDMSNVHIIVDGGPLGEMGLGKSQFVGAVNPFLEAAGIDITRDTPNVGGAKITVRSYSGDLWGAGGDDAGVTQLAMAAGIGSNHHQVDPNVSYLVRTKEIDGVVYEEWAYKEGPQHPLGRMLYDQGMYVSPAFDRVLDSIAPVTHIGEETKYADANEVSAAVGALIDDTIKFHTGVDSQHAQRIIEKVMQDNPEYANDLQDVLQLTRTIDRVALMANDPATIKTELPIVLNEIEAALKTTETYMKPNSWVDVINNGLNSAGLGQVIQIPHFREPEAGSWADKPYTATPRQTLTPEATQATHNEIKQNIETFATNVQNWVNEQRDLARARQAVADAHVDTPPAAPAYEQPTPDLTSNPEPVSTPTPEPQPQQTYTPTPDVAPPAAPAPEAPAAQPVTPEAPVQTIQEPAPAANHDKPITTFFQNIGEAWRNAVDAHRAERQRGNSEVHVDTGVPVDTYAPVEDGVPLAPAPR